MQQSIVYLAHGPDRFHQQTRFAIYSALHYLLQNGDGNVRILVYTDQPEAVPEHEFLSVFPLSRHELATLRGASGYVHRAKLAVLAQAADAFPGPLIYVDCDTKWIGPPDAAFQRLRSTSAAGRPAMLMHELETTIAEDVWPEYFAELTEGYPFQQRLDIAKPWVMWNSGVIGLEEPGDFFREALAVCDEMLPRTARKNWTEQLAISLLGNSRFEIRPADDLVRHYWQQTFELPFVVESALEQADRLPGVADAAAFCARYPVRDQAKRLSGTWRMRTARWLRRIRHSVEKRRLAMTSGR